MKIKIELEHEVLNQICGVLLASDPTGFFIKGIIDDLRRQFAEQMRPKENKDPLVTKIEEDASKQSHQPSGFVGQK